ncbi:MAG: putative transrane anti-sigma factor [Actinomycetia bacterium]|nr:putative transrane anti-sigma factor [Actinomycetes bacterium]
MSHLGERLTALVDGELGHDERDRAFAHLARCDQCRAEADTQRRLKCRLRGLGDVAPPAELIGRLYALGLPPEPRVPVRQFLVAAATMPPRATEARRPGDNRPRGGRPGARANASARAAAPVRRMPRARYLVVSAASLAVFGVGTASFVGADSAPTQRVMPVLDRFVVEHTLTGRNDRSHRP